MGSTMILLQGVVVIAAILLGVRTGGIGLGLWGLVGLAVLVFGFGLPPGDPPTTSMFIILSVITAASTMQSVGGIDYLVEVAKKLLKKRPAYIAVIAPIVAFIFTLGAGTGFIYYPLIPVIFAVAFANNVRPERPLAVASTASQFAITASPGHDTPATNQYLPASGSGFTKTRLQGKFDWSALDSFNCASGVDDPLRWLSLANNGTWVAKAS